MSKLLITILGTVLLAGLSACNTVSGVGRDVSAVGRDIEGGAQGVENAMHND